MLEEYDKEILEFKLTRMKEAGVALVCDGRPKEPEQIAARCVCEEGCYMADYVFSNDGALTELRYDKISCK